MSEDRCLLCVKPLDANNHDVVFVTCSAAGCDRKRPYHADCARAIQLSKKSSYTRALDHYHKLVSTATYELKHLQLAESVVPVQCMHAIEPHASCPVSAYTGCTGVIIASSLLRKMLPSGAPPPAAVKSPRMLTPPTTPRAPPAKHLRTTKSDPIPSKTPKLKLLPALVKPLKPAPVVTSTPAPEPETKPKPEPDPEPEPMPQAVMLEYFHPLFYKGPNFTSIVLNALKA